MVHVDSQKVQEIGQLLNDSKRPLKERFRALFTLKNLGGAEAINAISQCFDDESALLKHELAYCLGQMQDPDAIPHLLKVLENRSQEPMVRHEAGKCHQLRHCPVVVRGGKRRRQNYLVLYLIVTSNCSVCSKR